MLFAVVLLVFGVLFCQANAITKLPNSNLMGCGYDAKIGEPVSSALRARTIMLDWNYNPVNPVNYGQFQYQIPDFTQYAPIPGSDSSCIVSLYTDTDYISYDLAEKFSFGYTGFYLPAVFSASRQTKNFQSQSSASNSYTAFSNQRVTCWRLVLRNLTLDPYFATDLAKLPGKFDNNTCKAFYNFFAMYGTHSIVAGTFGGSVSMQTSFSKSLYSSASESIISRDIGMQFLLSTSSSLSQAQQKEKSSLDARYRSQISLVGGNPASYTPQRWNEWADTVYSMPQLLSFQLRSHADVFGNTTLDTAIRNYLLGSTCNAVPAPPQPNSCPSPKGLLCSGHGSCKCGATECRCECIPNAREVFEGAACDTVKPVTSKGAKMGNGSPTIGGDFDDSAYWASVGRPVMRAIDVRFYNCLDSFTVSYSSYTSPRHGGDGGEKSGRFELANKEYITTVSGFYGSGSCFCNGLKGCPSVIRGIQFTTNKGRTSPLFGTQTGERWTMSVQVSNASGYVITSFFGNAGAGIDAIGATWSYLPTLPSW